MLNKIEEIDNINEKIVYLATELSKSIEYTEYSVSIIGDLLDYIEYIKPTSDLTYSEWIKINNNEEELKIIKRNKIINEIIK